MYNFEQVIYTDDKDMISCYNCGRCWDGFAQCCCYGIPIDEETDENEQVQERKTRTHTMTLRSHIKDKVNEEDKKESEINHPDSWSSHTHYGQCGQSCPCCRAIVGDKWGACSICINK